ncbi:MAG: hypothetical protein U5L96_20590 [Owenweeksia sp.]|nr:hypothetical protein [Owenweeksia sp.]
MAHSKFRQLILVLLLTPALVFAAWCSWQVYDISTQRANIKDDFSEGNSIYYGLLSVNNWREEIKNIVRNRIDEFELNNKQDSLLRIEISSLLHTMIYKAESQIEQDDDGVRKTLRKWVVNAAVNWDNLHQQVPGFTETILEELTSEASKERLKEIALSKVEDLAAKLHDDSVDIYLNRLYGKYNTQSLPAFNETIKTKAKAMDEETYRYTYWTVSVVLLFLLMWFLTKKYPELRKPLMLMSVLLAIVVLFRRPRQPHD